MEASTVKDDKIVTTTIDMEAKKAIDKTLTVRDKLLIALQAWAMERDTNEIYQTIPDLAAKAGVNPSTASVEVWRMTEEKVIETIKERSEKNGRQKVVGFILRKAANPAKIVASGAEKAKAADSRPVKKLMTPRILPHLVHVKKYMEQKEAVEKARQILTDAGLGGDTITFTLENPYAEEAVQILAELTEATRLLGECRIEVEAARQAAPFTE